MKKISTVLCLMLISAFSFSQVKNDSLKNEIGFGISDMITSLSGNNFFPTLNLSYKRVYNKNVFRSGVTYNYFATDRYTPGANQSVAFLITNVGYERRFFDKKVQLLVGVDLCYSHFSNLVRYDDKYIRTQNIFGVGPVVGLIYNPNKRWSFQTEFGLNYGPGKEKIKIGGKNIWTHKGNFFCVHRAFSFNIYYKF